MWAGLIQALGRMSSKPDIPIHLDWIARAILVLFSAGFGLLAYYLYGTGLGLGFWASSFAALILFAVATIAPRSVRVGVVNFLPWF